MIPCESTGDFVRRIASEPRGPGRPPTGTPIHIRVDPDVLARIDAIAERSDITRAVVIRHLLAERLAAWPYNEDERLAPANRR